MLFNFTTFRRYHLPPYLRMKSLFKAGFFPSQKKHEGFAVKLEGPVPFTERAGCVYLVYISDTVNLIKLLCILLKILLRP